MWRREILIGSCTISNVLRIKYFFSSFEFVGQSRNIFSEFGSATVSLSWHVRYWNFSSALFAIFSCLIALFALKVKINCDLLDAFGQLITSPVFCCTVKKNMLQVFGSQRRTAGKQKDLNDLNLIFNIEFTRSLNMSELRKLRRQFISYTKMHPTENIGHISNMFVQYLNKSLC